MEEGVASESKGPDSIACVKTPVEDPLLPLVLALPIALVSWIRTVPSQLVAATCVGLDGRYARSDIPSENTAKDFASGGG